MTVSPFPSRLARGLCAAAGAFLAVSAWATPAAAQEDPGTVTWSVRPANETGEDGRAWVEQELDPGETATEHLAVHNLSDQEVTFRISAADAYFQENGRFIVRACNAHQELVEALDYLLQQTVDMDLAYGIELTEGEREARAKALAAIEKAYGQAA